MPEKTDPYRGSLAVQLARVDLESALAIARDFPTSGRYTRSQVLRNTAFHLAADNPAAAERVMRQIPPQTGQDWLPPAIAWKMATVDRVRATRLVEESQRHWEHPQMYLFLALGLKLHDPVAAGQAVETAMYGLDRAMQSDQTQTREMAQRDILLPLVEQIDPALVPEYFWRVVAARPIPGNPRRIDEFREGLMVMLLAWYDRDVATALFEPIRYRIDRADDREMARWTVEFLAWSMLDPHAAAARLEQVQVSPRRELGVDPARREVYELLALSREARWRRIWGRFTAMGELSERELSR